MYTQTRPAIRILHEDNHLLVVEKPVNLPVQADASGDEDLLSLLKKDLKVRYQKPGNVFLGLVHRLDRPTGGVMVFAKTSKAASRLSDSFREKQAVDKVYLAVVHGKAPSAGTLKHHLWKDQKRNRVFVVPAGHRGAKEAVLHFERLAVCGPLSLMRIRLETGRSHQIRVQFSEIGHPLHGDQKYGTARNKPGQQLALWAHRLTLPHPVKKEEMTFVSFPPQTDPWMKFGDFGAK
ncbi:RluA family pseudouridine synthase [Staphylospora marina]|uniref:RluA family pseudouridine synthase n=1 Tax=Staphylospora marina TaxID=2490858 RepID=UPI000F5BCBCC|nr:RluA family pseudouridine synthase [Staphylospora marina]